MRPALISLSPRSVRTRLILWSVGVLALALVVFGGALRGIVQANLIAAVDRSLADQGHMHQERTARQLDFPFGDHGGPRGPGPDGPGPDGPGREGPGGPPPRGDRPRLPRPPGGAYAGSLPARVLDLHGRPLIGWSAGMSWDADAFRQSASGRTAYSIIRFGTERIRVFSAPILLHGRVAGVVQTAASLAEADAEMAHLTRALLTLIPLVLLIAGAGGAFLTGRTLRPIRDITQAARRVEAESLSGRLTVAGNDEFSELASTFNGMLARLEGAFHKLTVAYEQEKRFTADASHELRTPLTVIKANSSLALEGEQTTADYREALEAIDQAVDHTNHLVRSLLLLARSDAGRMLLAQKPVSLASVAARAAHAVGAAGAAIQVCIPEDFPRVLGDPDALLQVFTNLLTNASRHTPPRGEITVTAQEDDSDIVILVADTGEGIAPEHLPHILERFYRVEASRSRSQGGSGLGLAICQEIVQAHHGSLSVSSTVGCGTTVRFTLPALLIRPDPVEANLVFVLRFLRGRMKLALAGSAASGYTGTSAINLPITSARVFYFALPDL